MTELSNTFVCIMGMGIVFIGLICIVLICIVLSILLKAFGGNNAKAVAPLATSPVLTATPEITLPPAEKSAVIAGICACIAEELGTDASNIKFLSFKRV